MQKIKRSFSLAGLLAFTVMTSCHKNNDNPGSPNKLTATVSMHLHGEDFNPAKDTSISGDNESSNFAYYISKPDYTTCSVSSKNDSVHLQVYFNGNKTSTQSAGDDSKSFIGQVKFQISLKMKDGSTRLYTYEDDQDTPGTITITKYGAVGDTIEGDFSGTLIDDATQYTLIVTNGHFKIPRGKDQTND